MRVTLASIGSLTVLLACGGGRAFHFAGVDAPASPTSMGGQTSSSTARDAWSQGGAEADATAQPPGGSGASAGGARGESSTPDVRLADAGTPDLALAGAPALSADANLGGASGGTGGRGGSGGGGNGGRGGSGGGGSGGDSPPTGGAAGICGTTSACGGDPAGTWMVKSSCLRVNGTVDISYVGLACLTAQIVGSVDVTGTLTLGADGEYADKTLVKGSDLWSLEPACLNLSGTRVTCDQIGTVFAVLLAGYGYDDFRCVVAATGGGCACQGDINETGGIGLLFNDISATGRYKLAGNTLSLGDGREYSYGVNDGELTVMPKPKAENATPYTGTVVFQRSNGGGGDAGP